MSSGCGRGADRIQPKSKRELTRIAKIERSHPSNQMTPEFGRRSKTLSKLFRQHNHQDPYPSKNERSVSPHSFEGEISLC